MFKLRDNFCSMRKDNEGTGRADMDFIANNWQVIFGGVGTAIVAALLARVLSRRNQQEKENGAPQATAGEGSQITQAGRDATVGNFHINKANLKK